MSQTISDHTIGFRDVVAPLRRRWKLVVVIAAMATVAGGAFGALQPLTYTASSALTVSPITLDPLASSSSLQTINITTEREVLQSSEVARIAAEALGTVDGATIGRASSVEAPSGGQVLRVSVVAPSPAEAADWANALANAYLQFRGQGAVQMVQSRLDDVNARIAAAENGGSAAGLAELRSEALALSQVGENPGRVIGLAQAPTRPSSPSPVMFVLAGVLGGLLVGALAAIVRDRADRRIRFAAILSRLTGTEALTVPLRDREALRWLHRQIRAGIPARRTAPVVVAAFGAPPADVSRLIAGLGELAGELDYRVQIVGERDLPAERLDRPWRFQVEGELPALVLVDAGHIVSDAQRATLAEGADVVLVAASAASRTAETARLVQVVESTTARLLTVFTDRVPAGSVKRRAVTVASGAGPAFPPVVRPATEFTRVYSTEHR